MTRINLWSGPRNISTALMYSFAQRKDTHVIDEPLYAYYLAATGIYHPGRDEIMAAQHQDANKVIEEVILADYQVPVVFFKQMTHHLIEMSVDFMQHTKNVLLIREPASVLASYQKVIEKPTLDDIGIRQAHELYHLLSEKKWHVCVLDSATLLRNPADILQKLCKNLEIPFDPAMLQWPAGARPEDGIWAKYWYANVHKSTGFTPFPVADSDLAPHVEAIREAAQPYYDLLKQLAIQ